ncbi:hypothetical protein DFJ43DRAFT_1107334 [Lentinula guzmanii]|uniref:RRM domain-containing protein n=3 Tax=Lentinula TaxID=5352 RepID=A0AA38JCY5_9AGAR|nr:hypothetical protein DFJ43DRAFT_1107334 [Lentinula guzmanii]KAJ3783337.1 hypothetical protein GGU10DRAFT_361167 [Lentinula aff. detonsa]KAJ3794060.1 hypothetical protein GGU11DRAFT_346724 [Lentinula aff. detonsa]KAJ3981598.1 hypothetical protein F5890DRAFT_513723 [Lentinula detonsa]
MSKVVFVGNVPYNMGEEQLIDVFKSVGQVVGFRLVYDRDTGKPKGYGFCEFTDHETASSAVRNLNNYEVGGRPLRIDLADSDPFLEGKTTVRGELMDGGGPSDRWRSDNTHKTPDFLASLPPGIPVPAGSTVLDTVSQTLATMNPSQLMDVLAHMKAFVITHPEQARTLLVSHPQFAYALFQALLLNKIVDQSILQRMLAATASSAAPAPAPTPVNVPPQQFYPSNGTYNTSAHMPPFPPNMAAPMFGPPPGSMPPPNYFRPTPPPPGMVPPSQLQHPPSGSSTPVLQQPIPVQANMYQRAQPPAQPNSATALNNISESHKALLRQVVSMSDDQVNALPETERAAIMQLRSQFGNIMPI